MEENKIVIRVGLDTKEINKQLKEFQDKFQVQINDVNLICETQRYSSLKKVIYNPKVILSIKL